MKTATVFGSLPMITQNVYIGTLVQNIASLGISQQSSNNDNSNTNGFLDENTQYWMKTASLGMGLVASIIVSRMVMKYASFATETDNISIDNNNNKKAE